MTGLPLIRIPKENDLGILVSPELSWTANAERSCEKAITDFYLIKQNKKKLTGKKEPNSELHFQYYHMVAFCGRKQNGS